MEVYTTEEQQVEVIKEWWKENGTSVIAGTVIGLVGLVDMVGVSSGCVGRAPSS